MGLILFYKVGIIGKTCSFIPQKIGLEKQKNGTFSLILNFVLLKIKLM